MITFYQIGLIGEVFNGQKTVNYKYINIYSSKKLIINKNIKFFNYFLFLRINMQKYIYFVWKNYSMTNKKYFSISLKVFIIKIKYIINMHIIYAKKMYKIYFGFYYEKYNIIFQ